MSLGVTSGGEGRHLGPTLEEVVSMYRDCRPAPSAPVHAPGTKKIGKILGATGKVELIEGGPSRQQIHALMNLGVHKMPATKEEAAQLIREQRDLQMGQRLGLVVERPELVL